MTISSTIRLAGPYNGTGAQVIFPFAFKVFTASDLLVILNSGGVYAIQTLTSQYTVTLYADQDTSPGGYVTMVTAPAIGATLTLTSQVPELQPTDVANVGNFYPQAVTDALDRSTIQIQQMEVKLQGTVRAPTGEILAPLPPAANRANNVMGFDASGNPTAVLPASGSGTALALDLLNNVNFSKGAALVAGALRTCDSLAALRLLPKTGSTRVLVFGYAVAGDQGGGQYYYDPSDTSSADNGGTIIVAADAGRWKFIGTPTVHTFGAKGDGTTYDGAAVSAAIAGTGGFARFLARRYNLNGWTLTSTLIAMIGAGKPTYNAAFTALNNDGTVLVGHWTTYSTYGVALDFGSDCGTATGLPAATGGFVMDAPAAAAGLNLMMSNISVLGASNTGGNAVHAVLLEGWDRANIRNVDVALCYHGIVYKGRRAFIGNTRGYRMGGDAVFVKSDVPASGGFVADATVQNVIVDGVYSETDSINTECNHVYVFASTAILSSVQVSNVVGTFGNAALRVAGGGASLYTTDVSFNNISSTGGSTCVDIFGTTYDTLGSNIRADNPKTAKAFIASGASSNWNLNNIELILTDGSIAGLYAADTFGTGSWNNFTVRSGIGTKRITFTPDTVKCGQKYGDVIIEGEGALVLGNNWASASPAARLDILPGNLMKISGRLQNTAAVGNSLAAVAGGVLADGDYMCVGYTSGGTATSCGVRWSAAGLTLVFPNYTVLAGGSLDLASLTMKR